MLKTNTKQYRKNIKNYILECIPEEWGNTEQEKFAMLKSEFNRVANHPLQYFAA